MIDLYTWATPNGRKVSIMLEELALQYKVHPVNILKDEQFTPAFLKLSPNNKIPAIVDNDTGISLMESGAILLYLAEKTGQLLPKDSTARFKVIEWLMWQMGGLGPMLGQTHHFLHFKKDASQYAQDRYVTEAKRLYAVLNQQLKNQQFIAGQYSIADIATWPWISRFEWHGIDPNDYPHVRAWYNNIAAREAVVRGYDVPIEQDIVLM